jgi:hypothetical protein
MTDHGRTRRLDLTRLSPLHRVATRTGLVVATATGLGVVAVGSGLVPASIVRVTPRGATTVLVDWVVVLPLLAIAAAAFLIVAARPDRRWRRVALAVLAGSWAGTIQLTVAETGWVYADSLPMAVWGARIASWIAIGLAVGIALIPRREPRSVVPMATASAVPFILIAGAYLLAASADGPMHVMRSALRDAIGTTFYASLNVLIVLFLWQAVEGVHASRVAVVATITRWSAPWVTAAIAIKMIAVTVAMLLVPPSVSPTFEAFRTDGPFAWAYALVLAVGLVTLLRHATLDPAAPSRHTVGAALLLLGFIAPALVVGAYVGLLAPLRLLLPGSVPEVAGLVVAAAVAAAVVLGGRARVRLAMTASIGATILVGALLANRLSEASTPLDGIHSGLLEFGWRLVGLHARWIQPWSVLVMVLALVAAGVVITRRRRDAKVPGVLLTIAAIGIWAAPRTVQVAADEFTGSILSIAPEPLTFDIALLLVVIGTIAWSLISRRRLPENTVGLGAAVGLVGAVTLTPELIRPLIEAVLGALEGPLTIDPANLGFALLLVIPAAYAFAFDSAALNARSASGAPLSAVGMTALIFGFAILQLAFSTQHDSSRELVALLYLVPLAALAAIGIGRELSTSGASMARDSAPPSDGTNRQSQ